MPDIVHRVGINAPLEEVYVAVSTAQGIANWWTREVSAGALERESVIGAVFRSPLGAEIGHMELEVARVTPSEVRWRFNAGPEEWIGTAATFELSRDGDMTLLVFGHRGWPAPSEFMSHCSMKWATFLLSLRQLAETGTGRPSPDDLKIDNWN
jgi:uncharacterized protein YndB with AHSA1/START domain